MYYVNLVCIQYGKHILLATLPCPNYWLQLVIPLTWSQQNTLAKVLEVIVISHSLTRAKDAFVSKKKNFFSLRENKLPNTNRNKILCIWELADYLCGDTEYNVHIAHFWKAAQSWLQKRNRKISAPHGGMDLKVKFTTSPQLVNSL